MLTPIAYGLAIAIALDLLVLLIGGRFLIAPRAAAAGYGVPAKPGGHHAYLTVKGLRDGTYVLVGLALLAFAGARAEAWFMADTGKGSHDMTTLSHVLAITGVLKYLAPSWLTEPPPVPSGLCGCTGMTSG
jgi:hypothetical protein